MIAVPLSLRIVFSQPSYIVIAAAIAIPFWILFNTFDQLLFFEPIWIFYLPDDAYLGFLLTTLISILLGVLISMNVYVVKHSKIRVGRTSLFSGSTLSIISGVCSSCSSVGFLLISTFGSIGVVASNLLTVYQIPLRIISLAILIFALYSIHKRITRNCVLDFASNQNFHNESQR